MMYLSINTKKLKYFPQHQLLVVEVYHACIASSIQWRTFSSQIDNNSKGYLCPILIVLRRSCVLMTKIITCSCQKYSSSIEVNSRTTQNLLAFLLASCQKKLHGTSFIYYHHFCLMISPSVLPSVPQANICVLLPSFHAMCSTIVKCFHPIGNICFIVNHMTNTQCQKKRIFDRFKMFFNTGRFKYCLITTQFEKQISRR